MNRALIGLKEICGRSSFQIIILVLLTLVITTKDISNGDFREADAFSHAINGVFIYDFIKDMPLENPYEYAVQFYAKYPNLTLPYHPPFFHTVEAITFFICGISPFSARLSIVFFSVLAVIFWYLFIKSMYKKEVAFVSSIFLITVPTIVFFSREVMLEMPTLAMIIISIYLWHVAIDKQKKRYLIYCAIITGLSMWTKQTAIFLLPLFLCHILINKKIKMLFTREGITAIVILLVLLIPLSIVTMKFARFAVIQAVESVQTVELGKTVATTVKTISDTKITDHNIFYYMKELPGIVSWPLMVLSILSLIIYLCKLEIKQISFILLWIAFVYIMITYISVKETRYAYFGIPPFCLLAGLLYDKINLKFKKIPLAQIAISIFCIVQIQTAYALTPRYIGGYEEAAKFVIQEFKGSTVLVSAYFHGNFIFHVRKYDTSKNIVVLRESKILPNPLKRGDPNYNNEEIHTILRDYGIKYIVTESVDRKSQRPRMYLLRKIMQSDQFELIKRIKLDTNMALYENHEIHIYEFKQDVKIPKDYIEIFMFKMRKSIKIPIKNRYNKK